MFVLLVATAAKEVGGFFLVLLSTISFSSVFNNFSIRKELRSFRGGKVHELDWVPSRVYEAKIGTGRAGCSTI